MPDERWQRVEELFDVAVAMETRERRRWLHDASGGDASLEAEVEALVEAERRSGDGAFIAAAVAAAAEDLCTPEVTSWKGKLLGPYRLLRELGHGGMGTVFLAERADSAYEAQVAVKLVRGGVAGSELVRRFVAERQILASLVHPNIARLLDGGTTDDGTPYLVMERIDGEPIDAYCEGHGLALHQRLQLFCQVCDAVQHAHGHLVVHRDIKPSNVLVTRDGSPKLLDFGVAKLIDPERAQSAVDTATKGRLLTPAYASPEQVRGEAITTAADVYSLGVLLYRLLTGSLPYGSRARNDVELAQAVLTEEPLPPNRLSTTANGSAPFGRDLEAVVLKALRKDPAQRYTSAEQLADDVRRYLSGQPVLARPGERRLQRFLFRHRRAVAAAAGAILALAAVSTAYVVRLARERDLAESERAKAQQVAAFLEGLFRVSDPNEARGRSVTAREVVDSAVARLPSELAGQPDVRAALSYSLGGVYMNLGLEHEALPLVETGFRLRSSRPGDGSPSVGDFLSRLGILQLDLGHLDSAAALLTTAVRRLDDEHRDDEQRVSTRVVLANAYRNVGRLAKADSVLEGAEARARTLGQDSVLAHVLGARGALYLSQRRGSAAEPVLREALRLYRQAQGADAPSTIATMSNLGQSLFQQSRYTEAEPIINDVLALRRRVLGDRHSATATAWNNLAALYQAEGRTRAALDAGREALAIYRANYGDRHRLVAVATSNLGSMLLAAGDTKGAERMHRDALRIELAQLTPGHSAIATAYNNLAHDLEEEGRFADAERSYRQAFAAVQQGVGAETEIGSIVLANLGGVLATENQLRDAEDTLRRALAIQRRVLPRTHAATATTLTTLGALLARTHRAAEAEPLLREALATRRSILRPDHWAIQVTRSALGECEAMLGRESEADSLLASSAEALRGRFGPDDRRVRVAMGRAERFDRERNARR